jgi:hypothetical protein
MRTIFRGAGPTLACLAALSSCTHGERGELERAPASQLGGAFESACQKMTLAELDVFRRVALSERGVTGGLRELESVARIFYQDWSERAVAHDHPEMLANILLGECSLVREGYNATFLVRKTKPELFERARQLCGLADSRISSSSRTHPGRTRDAWSELDDNTGRSIDPTRPGIRAWVSQANEPMPDGPQALCLSLYERRHGRNLEDAVEQLFLCSDAHERDLAELRERPGSERSHIEGCLDGLSVGSVEIAEDGMPRRGPAPVADYK